MQRASLRTARLCYEMKALGYKIYYDTASAGAHSQALQTRKNVVEKGSGSCRSLLSIKGVLDRGVHAKRPRKMHSCKLAQEV